MDGSLLARMGFEKAIKAEQFPISDDFCSVGAGQPFRA
jgi:hypothetical protein